MPHFDWERPPKGVAMAEGTPDATPVLSFHICYRKHNSTAAMDVKLILLASLLVAMAGASGSPEEGCVDRQPILWAAT